MTEYERCDKTSTRTKNDKDRKVMRTLKGGLRIA